MKNSHPAGLRQHFITLAVLSLTVSGGLLAVSLFHSNGQAIPDNVRKSVDFAVYYPSRLPKGYDLKNDSVRNENGIIFFVLNNGDRNISVSEQAAPTKPLDLNLVLGFQKIEAPAGSAIQGLNNGAPAAILLTNTTLVNLNASKNTPNDVVAEVVKNMHSVRQ